MSTEICQVTLYDVPLGASGKPWSPNMWKARYALNFKGIPYKTTWLEYPEIELTMRRIGALPTGTKADGSPYYTLPVIVDHSRQTPSGGPTVVSESFLIAEYLDHAYPSAHPLFPEGTKALQKFFYDQSFTIAILPILPILVPEAYICLNEGSRPYYRQAREVRLGGKIEEVCPKGSPKWDESWLKVQKGLASLAELFDKNGSDVNYLITGKHVTFSDLVVAAFLESIFVVLNDDWTASVCSWDGGRWKKLRETCAQWRAIH